MGTRFYGEGNIGSDPEVRTFPVRDNQPPRTLLRLNVRFDNLVPKDGEIVDRGGFWWLCSLYWTAGSRAARRERRSRCRQTGSLSCLTGWLR